MLQCHVKKYFDVQMDPVFFSAQMTMKHFDFDSVCIFQYCLLISLYKNYIF